MISENQNWKTRTWKSLAVFEEPLSPDRIKFKETKLHLPKGLDEVIRGNWDEQLKKKQEALRKEGIKTEIKLYYEDKSDAPLNALYEGDVPKMWPGPVVTMTGMREENGTLNLLVGQTSFPFIEALKDEDVKNLYAKENILVPRPSLAICTYAVTQDDKITLRVNGTRTNMYPNRIHGQGGNPLFTDTDVAEHQVDEMADEILVKRGDYNLDDMKFSGIIVDTEQLPNKPDLLGWIPVNLDSDEIRERNYRRPMNKRPNDSIGVVFAPAKEGELFDYLVKQTHPVQFGPPGHGGLVLYGHHNFGSEWSRKVLKKIE